MATADRMAKETAAVTEPAVLSLKGSVGYLPSVCIKSSIADSNFEPGQGPPRWLIVSPYPETGHLLDLEVLNMPDRLLALASTELEPATAQYATVQYDQALDWISLMATLKLLAAKEGYRWTRHEFYVVEFRSKLKKTIDAELLFKLDKESHKEAMQSGGLLKYWYGVPDANRSNLATCKCYKRIVNGPIPNLQQVSGDVKKMLCEEVEVPGTSRLALRFLPCMTRSLSEGCVSLLKTT